MTLAERETVTPYARWRGCHSKTLYFSAQEADLAVRAWRQQRVAVTSYRCDWCGLFHLSSQFRETAA
jgi:hypothetical protein